MENKKFILSLSCSDRLGIINAISAHLFKYNGFILDSAQYSDEESRQFFMRLVFETPTATHTKIEETFHVVAEKFHMQWSMQDVYYKPKLLIMVSKESHCLIDILHKTKLGALQVEIPAIISNHKDLEYIAKWYEVPFYHLPITKQNKESQEEKILEEILDLEIDIIALARYMQILSPSFCKRFTGKMINIHHSFLPSFKGAKPYHQAYERGVKIIGATSHYVTEDLDEGPIIDQEVAHVNHNYKVENLISAGKDVEASVLSRSIELQSEKRIFLNGNKTVVFKR